jgi:uncharacterized protein
MGKLKSQQLYLPWWIGGILLGLIQVIAIHSKGPLEVSSHLIVLETKALEQYAPEYAQNHPLMNNAQQNNFNYSSWFVIGLLVGVIIVALYLRIWKIQYTTLWWQKNHNVPVVLRLTAGLFGGFLLLFGAAIAQGDTAGHFISGWTQLSLSAVPFTIAVFIAAAIVAHFVYPKTP